MTRSHFNERRAQEDKWRFGTQGAASEVRLIDLASVDMEVLIEQMKGAEERSQRRLSNSPTRRGLLKP